MTDFLDFSLYAINVSMIDLNNTDKDQMTAGAKIASALTELLALNPSFSKEQKEIAMKNITKLILPHKYKNITAELLLEMKMNEYIEEASILMMKKFKERIVSIKVVDTDLVDKLCNKWEDRGFTISRQFNEKYVDLTLSW